MLLSGVAVIYDGLKTLPIGRAQINGDTSAHPADSHTGRASGILNPDSPDRITPLGVDGTTQLANKAGVRMLQQYLKGAALVAAKQAFERVGVTFTRVALEKALPFGVGVAVSSTANYALTSYVGRTTICWFVLDAEVKAEAAQGQT